MTVKKKKIQEDLKDESSDHEGFSLKEHLLSLVESIFDYFETLLLYLQKTIQEKVKLGIQVYILFRIGLFFLSFSVLFFIGGLFLFFQKYFSGDPLLAALGTGGVCLGISLILFSIIGSLVRSRD
ncbi:hypothetical protein CH373_07585 [Leptospira perolatii]|uniref:Uncharacterized protein n=1 Tax=Leptospira perolatii TaxID=2023191 RepID=A0A2M9ZPI7_9LEPT|nr:hypothetical protein CH360_04445 [Leptospira perolatii]PJZ73976.1 hypothetical protein CH373_07585 [Leptospira perolatii]